MLAYITWQSTGRPAAVLQEERLLGLPVAHLAICGREGFFLTRKVRRHLRRLESAGVRQGLWPPELPHLWREGLAPVPVWPLRRALLPELIGCAAQQWGLVLQRGTVLVTAAYTDPEVRRAAELLVGRCRYLRLDTGRGREQLEEHLRWQYGLAPSGAGHPLLQVSFDGRSGPRTIRLDQQAEAAQRVVYGVPEHWEEGVCCREPLLAYLWQAGRLPLEGICVKSLGPALDRVGETHYNAI